MLKGERLGGSAPKTPGIFRFSARIPGSGCELRSHPPNPGPWVGARGASPQSSILRPGRIRISNGKVEYIRNHTASRKKITKIRNGVLT